MKRQSGLSMVEILIVVSVLVVLISLNMPRFSGVEDSGKKSQAETELKTLQLGVTSYYLHSNPHVYPPTTTRLAGAYLTGASPKIIKAPLYDPFGASATTEYDFVLSSNSKYYAIYSRGTTRNGAVSSVSDTGAVSKTNNPICVTNGSGCNIASAGGVVTDKCGGCTGGKFCCNGTCIDRGTDVNNCGACDNQCTGGRLCCHGTCTFLGTDDHCSACGDACLGANHCCSGSCVNTQTSTSNCGGCGVPCNYACVAGVCDEGDCVVWGNTVGPEHYGDWSTATSYCSSLGGRLPTHAEILAKMASDPGSFNDGSNYLTNEEYDATEVWAPQESGGSITDMYWHKNSTYLYRCYFPSCYSG